MEGAIEKSARDLSKALAKSGVEVAEMPALPHQFFNEPRAELFEGISPAGSTFLKNAAEGCRNYLTGVYMKDGFGSKQERDDWEEGMRKEFGDEFTRLNDRSKLRRSTIGHVFSNIDIVVYYLNPPMGNVQTETADKVRELHKRIPDPTLSEYEGKTYEEKLDFAKKVDDIAESFLRLVTAGTD